MAETPDNAEAVELHQVSVELWLIGRRDEALRAFRQALGGESDAIALQLRDTLPNSYDDPDATPDRPINLQQQNAFAAYRNTARMTTDDARALRFGLMPLALIANGHITPSPRAGQA